MSGADFIPPPPRLQGRADLEQILSYGLWRDKSRYTSSVTGADSDGEAIHGRLKVFYLF